METSPSHPLSSRVLILAAVANVAFLLRYVWTLWPFTAIGGDFTYFWTTARMAWAGQASRIYDVAAFTHALRSLLPYMPAGEYAVAYPPPFPLMLAPLGALPLSAAFLTWMLISLAAFVAVLRTVYPHPSAVVMAILSPAFAINLWFGQNGLIFGALMGVALLAAGKRPLISGAALGLLSLKPHLAAALGAVFLLGRRWTVLAAAAATAAAACALSAMVLGADVWLHFLASFHQAADLTSARLQGVSVRGSVYWTLRTMGAPPVAAMAAQGIAALSAAVLVGRLWRDETPPLKRVTATAAALPLILPRLGTYDLALFTIAAAALAGASGKRHAPLALGFWMAPQIVQMAAVHDIQILAPVSALLLAASLRLEGRRAEGEGP